MPRAYKFTMTPEMIDDVTEYLKVNLDREADEVHEEIEDDPEGYFGELVGDRYPGYVLESWEEIDPDDIPKNEHPFTLG